METTAEDPAQSETLTITPVRGALKWFVLLMAAGCAIVVIAVVVRLLYPGVLPYKDFAAWFCPPCSSGT